MFLFLNIWSFVHKYSLGNSLICHTQTLLRHYKKINTCLYELKLTAEGFATLYKGLKSKKEPGSQKKLLFVYGPTSVFNCFSEN